MHDCVVSLSLYPFCAYTILLEFPICKHTLARCVQTFKISFKPPTHHLQTSHKNPDAFQLIVTAWQWCIDFKQKNLIDNKISWYKKEWQQFCF